MFQVVDTVRLIARGQPTDEQLETYWTRQETISPNGKPHLKYVYNRKPDTQTYPRLTYRPESDTGKDQLLIEMSMPKIVFGNNWQLITDMDAALARCDEVLTSSEATPELVPMAEMTVSRLDLCCHFEVARFLPNYIDALGRLDYPHRTTIHFNAQTVEYRAKSVKTKFYDKHAETKGEAPVGTLRLETTFHRARQVKAALDTKLPVHLPHITPDIVEAILARDLHRLGILDRPFATADTAARRLREHFGTTRGPRLYGVLCIYQRFSRQDTADILGINRNAVSRLLADIRKAGIATALTDTEQDLPPLQVSLPRASSSPETCTQTPGVTQGSLASEAHADEVTDDDDH